MCSRAERQAGVGVGLRLEPGIMEIADGGVGPPGPGGSPRNDASRHLGLCPGQCTECGRGAGWAAVAVVQVRQDGAWPGRWGEADRFEVSLMVRTNVFVGFQLQPPGDQQCSTWRG